MKRHTLTRFLSTLLLLSLLLLPLTACDGCQGQGGTNGDESSQGGASDTENDNEVSIGDLIGDLNK